MAKKEDLRPNSHKPAEGQTTQPSGWSGFQPSDKFSSQGSTTNETDITKHQRE